MDPYQVLGVSRDATDEDIKKAYRLLSRKYHPDANINNPNKAQAEAKFKEVQQAYQLIMREKAGGSQGSYGQSSSGSYRQSGYSQGGYQGQGRVYADENEPVRLKAAANYINSGYYQEALNVLNDIDLKDAKWYYYSAVANFGIGNNVTALQHAKTAASMAPDRADFAQLVQTLTSGGSWYQNQQTTYGSQSPVDMSGNCYRMCCTVLALQMCCGGGMCYGPYCCYL